MKRSGCAIEFMLAALLVLLCQSRALAADDYMLKLGERYYKAGDYKNAASSLQSALTTQPNNAYAHYMLANTLVNLKQNGQAATEYQKAAGLDPGGAIATYSNQALATLTRQYAQESQRAASPVVPQKSTDASGQKSGSPPEMSDDEKRLNAECDTKISQINRETQDRIMALRQEQNERIAANGQQTSRPVTVGWGPYGPIQQMVPYYDPAPANDAVNREYAMKEDVLKGQGLKRIEETKSYYAKRIEALKGR
jgi:tetratricopeptide (TPR) repeat protein